MVSRDVSCCPACGKEIGPDAVLCVHCGFDNRTGRRARPSLSPSRPRQADDTGARPVYEHLVRDEIAGDDETFDPSKKGMPIWAIVVALVVLVLILVFWRVLFGFFGTRPRYWSTEQFMWHDSWSLGCNVTFSDGRAYRFPVTHEPLNRYVPSYVPKEGTIQVNGGPKVSVSYKYEGSRVTTTSYFGSNRLEVGCDGKGSRGDPYAIYVRWNGRDVPRRDESKDKDDLEDEHKSSAGSSAKSVSKKSAYERIEKGMSPPEVEKLLRECIAEEDLPNAELHKREAMDCVSWIEVISDDERISVIFDLVSQGATSITRKAQEAEPRKRRAMDESMGMMYSGAGDVYPGGEPSIRGKRRRGDDSGHEVMAGGPSGTEEGGVSKTVEPAKEVGVDPTTVEPLGTLAAFVVPNPVSRIFGIPPEEVLKKHGVVVDAKLIWFTEQKYVDHGTYHFFRIPNPGRMIVKWVGHSRPPTGEEAMQKTMLYCWNGQRYDPESCGIVRSDSGHTIVADRPDSEPFVYVVACCQHGQICTDAVNFTYAPAKPVAGDTPSKPCRTWTDSTGKYRIVAEFVSYGVGTVTLKKLDGTVVKLPMDRLADADQKWIRDRGR